MSDHASLERTVDGLLKNGNLDDPRAELWDKLREHGVVQPFQAGLTSWAEAGTLIRAVSRHAPRLPIAENIVASYLLKAIDAPLDVRHVTLADPSESELVLSHDAAGALGIARFVPHAAVSSHLFAEAHDATRTRWLLLIELRAVEAHGAENIAREPRDELLLRGAPVLRREPIRSERSALYWLGALARATQIAGLSESVLDMTIEHARTRKQFGHIIGSFQAVQQQLASLACEVAALGCAVALAEREVDRVGVTLALDSAAYAIAAAKVQAGLTARVASEVGHAVHAAIGFTREHRLHRYTQRLLSYRAELGADREHARFLGARAIARGGDMLWQDIVARSHQS